MIRLYFDEDIMDNDLVDALRARGIDVKIVSEAGMAGREDHEQLTYATEDRRVIYSANIGHFCELHTEVLAAARSHAGIVLCQQQRYTIGEQMHRLLRLIAAVTAEEMQNRLEFLGNWPDNASV